MSKTTLVRAVVVVACLYVVAPWGVSIAREADLLPCSHQACCYLNYWQVREGQTEAQALQRLGEPQYRYALDAPISADNERIYSAMLEIGLAPESTPIEVLVWEPMHYSRQPDGIASHQLIYLDSNSRVILKLCQDYRPG